MPSPEELTVKPTELAILAQLMPIVESSTEVFLLAKPRVKPPLVSASLLSLATVTPIVLPLETPAWERIVKWIKLVRAASSPTLLPLAVPKMVENKETKSIAIKLLVSALMLVIETKIALAPKELTA